MNYRQTIQFIKYIIPLLFILLTSYSSLHTTKGRISDIEEVYDTIFTTEEFKEPVAVGTDIYGSRITYYLSEVVSFYHIQDTTIWYKDSVNNRLLKKDLLKNGNVASFKDLGAKYAKDKSQVYYKGVVVEGAMPKSFRHSLIFKDEDGYIDTTEFARDHKHVFLEGKMIEGADAKSFRTLTYLYYGDKKQVYYDDGTIIEGANPDDFREWDYPYYVSRDKIYTDKKQVEGVDIASFMVISITFSKDKNHAYYKEKRIENADPGSFIAIDYRYSKDKNHVYYGERLVEGADPASFVLMATRYEDYISDGIIDSIKYNWYQACTFYAVDRESVFYGDKKLEGVNVASFHPINKNLLCDSFTLYNNYGSEMCHIDAASFIHFNKDLYLDKNYAYLISYGHLWGKEKIDRASFRRLSDYFYCDTGKVFYCSSPYFKHIKEANPQSFRVICGEVAYDNRSLFYSENHIRSIEIGDSLYHLGDDFYKDEYNLYKVDCREIRHIYSPGKSSKVDIKTLKYKGNHIFEDKNGVYNWEELRSQK